MLRPHLTRLAALAALLLSLALLSGCAAPAGFGARPVEYSAAPHASRFTPHVSLVTPHAH
jgi:hypothetical protein